ncbi:MAG: TonB-dependent receptor [Ignavibacteria bacterium]|nr:TonB-dependent receptor [Ignavibacteria bacterium]
MKQLVQALLVFASFTALALAGTTGKVAGIVKDQKTGEPIIGANVVLQGTTLGASTDVEGRYVILRIPPGTYTLVVNMIGYTSVRITDVRVNIDLTTKVDVELSETVLELGQVIEVVSQRPLVRRDMTSVEARVEADAITNMPVQEVGELLNLQAGVTVGRDGAIHIRGGRSSEIAYWVDGKPITDAFDGSLSIPVENNAIQELQVVSGTFNAEYGNAMSGIVNIVTKDGGAHYAGNVRMYSGDYVSGDSHTFAGIDNVSLLTNYNIEGSLSGPVPLGNDLVFYLFGRYFKTDGWLYGNRKFNTDGLEGDGVALPMNWSKKFSFQGKLRYELSSALRLSISTIGNKRDYQDYNHFFRLNPDGDVTKHEKGYDLTAVVTHVLSPKTFYTLNVSKFNKEFREYLYEDPFDSRYYHPDSLNEQSYSFSGGGTNLHHFRRQTTTYVGKFDLTSQVTPLHQVKVGLEAKLHRLYLDEFNVVPAVDAAGRQIIPFQPDVRDITSPLHDQYTRYPREFSVYVQDKFEYENLIINLGLRFDYFDPRADILDDPEDPNIYLPFKQKNKFDVNGDGIVDQSDNQADASAVARRLAYWYRKARPKSQISPRLGVAYPITDRGVIHFSYGHFIQIPTFIHLYQRPGYKVTTASILQGVFGNPDLKPQKTVMYEIGLQQQISEDIGMDITGFYRDIRDWVTAGPPIATPVAGTAYSIYINKDYANMRGVTLSMNKRLNNYYSFNISYTYQVAEGVNSSPDEEFFAARDGADPTKQLIPLDWDQTHTFNATVGVGQSDYGAYMIARYGSGLPYSPSITIQSRQGQNLTTGLLRNSRRRPSNFTFDLRGFKGFDVFGLNLSVFLAVLNVLDTRNAVDVYGDTGLPDKSLVALYLHEDPSRNNTIAEWFNNPSFYSEPREVQFGFEISF